MAAAVKKGEPLWLICRGRATARAVLLALMQKGDTAWAGLRVTTLSALLAEASGRALWAASNESSSPQLPAGHPWAEKLAERPGLRHVLHRHLERFHALAAAGQTLPASPRIDTRPEIAALLSAGWGRTSWVGAVRRLARRVPAGVPVGTVGFGEDGFSFAGQLGHFERALLTSLKAKPLHPSSIPSRISQLKTWVVADPHAEARAIARHALHREHVLVLVPDDATGSRVRAALLRNGVAVADRGFLALKQHALVALLRPLVPLCGSRGEAPVDYEALLHLLLSPVLSRSAVVAEEEDPFAYEEEAPRPAVESRLSLPHAKELLLRCRRLRATLPEWRDRLRGESFELTGKESTTENEAQRQALRSRLDSARVLIDRLELLLTCSREGTLAGLGTFVQTVGLADAQGDRLGRAIVRALSIPVPATEASFEEALSGVLASTRLDEGAEVLNYEEYDGRHAGLLLCAGVHDKGLSRSSLPDPFLTECDYATLGLAHGQARVHERLGLLRWAVTNAGEALAFSARADAGGRRVSLPVELAAEVVLDGSEQENAYGLSGSSELPELVDLHALTPALTDAPERPELLDKPVPKRGEDVQACSPLPEDRLCLQVDAEWVRAGWRIRGRTPENLPPLPRHERPVPLSTLLEERDALLPPSLRPYLGDVPPPALPEGFTLSATRLADFTQCLYRAFMAHALKLRAPEDVEEEYSPSELGDFIHDALAETTLGLKWIVPSALVKDTRQRVLDSLCAATERRFAKEDAALGSDVSAAILAARRNVLERWKRHWAIYLESRITSVEGHNAGIFRWARRRAEGWPEYDDALQALGVAELKTTAAAKRVKQGLSQALEVSEGNWERALSLGTLMADLKSEADIVSANLHRADRLLPLFRRYASTVRGLLAPREGDQEVVAAELPFGPALLRLGTQTVPVHGRIDSVVRAGNGYHVVDYKTGGKDQTSRTDLEALTHPQLLFYGLAVREVRPDLPVTQVAYDAVKEEPVRFPLSATQLDEAAESFGALMERAREGKFSLLPHPLRCPLVSSKAHCDFAEVCRFREAFAPTRHAREEGAPQA